ncbi:MAG: HAD hydrolase family protein [Faecalibacterium sp.]|jgi:hydroxymethylpyrimidine pyrophosphatase-like HAD family hydrolase|nr:HAD hydrolase family protein [Faecalibacterium sp.]
MEKLPIRLIAFDLDGTVLNHEKIITPRTHAALAAAAKKGVVLAPATGRTLANLSVVEQLPGLLPYALTSNGAAVWQLGSRPEAAVRSRWGENIGAPAGRLPPDCRCVALKGLSAQKALEVHDVLAPFLPGNLKAFLEGRSVSARPSYDWEQAHGSAGFRPGPGLSTVVESLPDALRAEDGRIEKFCMFFRDEKTLCAARTALGRITDIEVVQGSPDNLEITAPGVDKGLGLRRLCTALGIQPEAALAIGDSENDWGMLRVAGYPAAMANATPETKALARYVSAADNDHDGVAELIEALVL